MIRHRLTYGNVVATLALVFALTGTAYAATKIRSKDIVDGQVKAADIAKDAITSGKVKNGSLQAADFKKGALPAGAPGAPGAAGAQGPAGPAGPAGANGKDGSDATLPASTDTLVPVAAFSYANGTLSTEAHRAPVTGPVTVSGSAGVYFVTLPGLKLKVVDDAVVCTGLASSGDVHTTLNSSGNVLEVRLYNGSGTAVSGGFSCTVTNVKDS